MVLQKIKTYVFPRGFTLVELIVVITILAILGTIGFLSLGGYSSKSRDSSRLTDVANISKSLDVSIITAGVYPTPDNSFAITYSGGTLWNQGVVGTGVLQALSSRVAGGGPNKKPIDPLDSSDYTYSSLAFGKAYQIKVNYEGDLNQVALDEAGFPVAFNSDSQENPLLSNSLSGNSLLESAFPSNSPLSLIETASAAPGAPTIAYIRGNYGGLTARTLTGSTNYILAIPSIITNSGTTAGGILRIENNALSGNLLFNGKTLKNASSFNPNTVVYSGATLPTTPSEITSLVTNLQTAYNAVGATDIKTNSSISTLLGTSGPTAIESLGGSIVSGQLGGGVKAVATPVIRNSLATNIVGWNVTSGTCPTCIYNAYTKNFGTMTLLQCEVEAAKNHATMFYPDSYQHPANGVNSWRWRIHGTYGVYSPQHSTHYEAPAGNTSACSLIKQVGVNLADSGGTGRVTTSIVEGSPWASGSANGYTYNIYRSSTTDPYICSLFLRVNGLNIYSRGVQNMLSNVTATMNNGNGGLCTHGNCGTTYGYLSDNTQSSIYGDNVSAVADGYCYGYTIYK